MIIHLIDGTYELFRHFYGLRRAPKEIRENQVGAVIGVLGTITDMIEKGATHLGVATDHVIESFRNELWPGYKSSAGIDPALRAQFEPLELALAAMGVTTWPMVELEADDALAAAARLAAADERVERVSIWTPDKDLAQCVRGDRVVQVDRRTNTIRDEEAVREKFGVSPEQIPDYLALVGDSADGFPGVRGVGPKTAARLIDRYGGLEEFPDDAVPDLDKALLFRDLATLRDSEPLFEDVEELRWSGPVDGFDAIARRMGASRVADRIAALADRL